MKSNSKTLPKTGRRKAAQTEEMTSVVLRRMKHHTLFETLTGSSSSILLAKGFINSAYLFNVKESNLTK